MSQSVILFSVLLVLLFITWGILGYLYKLTCQLKNELSSELLTSTDLKHKLTQIDDEIYEMRTGSQALSRKVKELIVELNTLQNLHQQMSELDPKSRFYQDGAKLIASGATLEEVMRECELPRAEAELLFSLHQR